MWKLLHYDHRLQVDDPQMREEAAAFVAWKGCLSEQALASPAWVKSFLLVADEASNKANARSAVIATKRFETWVTEGPAAGLKRQHLFSRTAVGWIPDKCDVQEEVKLSELDDLEGISAEQLRAALAYSPHVVTPSLPRTPPTLKVRPGGRSGP